MIGSITSRNSSPAAFVAPALAIRNAVNRAAASPAVMFRAVRLSRSPRDRVTDRIFAGAATRITAVYTLAERHQLQP